MTKDTIKIIIISISALLVLSGLIITGMWFFLKESPSENSPQTNSGEILNRNSSGDKNLTKEKEVVEKNANNYVDLPNLKVGDKVADMPVTSLRAYSSEQRFLPMSENNVSIKFNGKLSLEGAYTYIEPKPDNTYKKKDFYITVTKESDLAKIPMLKNDDSKKVILRLEFYEDISKLQKMFKISNNKTTGTATLIVENYTLNRFTSGDASNLVTLIEIKELK